MKKLNLNQKHFHNREEARKYLEKIRWVYDIPVCPHCGSKNEHYELKSKTPTSELREGVWKCKDCRNQFSVTVGTVFERSHIPLNKWLLAVQLFCSSKKGISARQIERMLGVKYKTAFFMMHRIRCAMEQNLYHKKLKGIIEVDETYIGGKTRGKRGRGASKKIPVAELAREIFFDYNIDYPDAIHIGSAIFDDIHIFNTFDKDLLKKDGLIGNPPLRIIKPDIPYQESMLEAEENK